MKYQFVQASDKVGRIQMEAFIAAHENGHFLQSPRWAQVKQSWRWMGVLAVEEDVIVGAMSLLIRPLPLGFSVLYAPRGPVCNRTDLPIMTVLLDGAREAARKNGGIMLHLDPDEPDTNEEFRKQMLLLGFSEQQSTAFDNIQPQYVFRLSLFGKTAEELFSTFSAKTRYNIRLAQRRGVELRRYSGNCFVPAEALDAFSRLMEETGQRDGFRVRDRAYFQNLLTALGDNAVLYLAVLEETPVAGSLAIFFGGKAWYLYGASSNTHRNVMPNYLLQWEMIQESLRRGCRLYDFRGVSGNLDESDPLYGLYRFKKGFSGRFTKFTGLFTYPYHPILARMLPGLLSFYRNYKKMPIDLTHTKT